MAFTTGLWIGGFGGITSGGAAALAQGNNFEMAMASVGCDQFVGMVFGGILFFDFGKNNKKESLALINQINHVFLSNASQAP